MRNASEGGAIVRRGMTLAEIRRRLIRLTAQERALHDEILQKTITLGLEAVNDVAPLQHDLIVEGAASILTKPEFADGAALRKKLNEVLANLAISSVRGIGYRLDER